MVHIRKLATVLSICLLVVAVPRPAFADQAVAADEALKAILDDVWQWRLDRNPHLRVQKGLPVERIPRGDFAEVKQDAVFAEAILQRLNSLSTDDLSEENDLFRRIVRHQMSRVVEEPRYFWLRFPITPYQSNFFTNSVWPVFSRFEFHGAVDAERYVSLARDYAAAVEQILSQIYQQEQRGVRLPQPAIPGVVELYTDLTDTVPQKLAVGNERLSALPEDARSRLQSDLAAVIDSRLVPALREIAQHIGGAYSAKAPASVGVAQYPDGRDYYRHLIRSYTTLDLTPEAIRDLGLRHMAELADRMARIRRQVGFDGSRVEFHNLLQTDGRFIAGSPDELEAIYTSCLTKLEPHLLDLFHSLPESPYGVRRARPEAEAGMTFGYYGRPEAPGEPGFYFYNGAGLRNKSTITACAMIYHELVPGHHFHVASQMENTDLHPLQTANYGFYAYNEGWAEYAASLGIEAQVYDDPYSLYGRYLMESHVYARLVLDTGLNYFGWTLDKAKDYLRQSTLLSNQEISSEVLRYSTDLPGQALSYGIGYETIWKLRRYAESAMDGQFDLRDFHEIVLGSGSMPMPVLAQEVHSYVENLAETSARKQ